jgi:opacity protein-like surface antigen
MNRFTTLPVICAALAALFVQPQAFAETKANNEVTGPYVGASFGVAFGNREIDDSNSNNDEGLGRGAKIFAGYQLTENFGLQVGYVRMTALNQNNGAGVTLVKQTVTGQSTYMAGTARLPLGRSFALTGMVGVSFGKVTDASPTTAATASLLGSNTSLLVGSGAEYAVSPNVSFSVNLESYGKISEQVKGNTLTLGTRFTF